MNILFLALFAVIATSGLVNDHAKKESKYQLSDERCRNIETGRYVKTELCK